MKVLVTGSNGLVGKKIAELLVGKKNSVVSFGHDTDHDILDFFQLKTAMKDCDAVIHCAAILNQDSGTEILWKTNVAGTQNVLDACIANKIKRLVFLSSVGVYGTAPGTKNETSTVSPKTVYDQTKAAAEELVIKNASVSYTIVRSALVVGPNRHWKKIFSFIRKDFPLVGSGQQTWQTIDYEDLADATLFLLFSKEAQNEIFVVASNEKPSLMEFTNCIRREMGKKTGARSFPLWLAKTTGALSGIFFGVLQKPNPLSLTNLEGMVQERSYDTSKIEKVGWKNTFSFQESIRKTMREIENK